MRSLPVRDELRFRHPEIEARLGTPVLDRATPRGRLIAWVAADIVVTWASGHADEGGSREFIALLDQRRPAGLRQIWDDWSAVNTYDSQGRELIRLWTDANRDLAPHIHVLVRSKLVAMGLTVANLAMGNPMQVYANAMTFETRLLATLRGHRKED
jgi:hypothetical protein